MHFFYISRNNVVSFLTLFLRLLLIYSFDFNYIVVIATETNRLGTGQPRYNAHIRGAWILTAL